MIGTFGGTIEVDDLIAAQRLHRAAADRRFLMLDLGLAVAGLALILAAHPSLLAILPIWGCSIGAMLVGAGVTTGVLQWVASKTLQPRFWKRLYAQQKSLHAPITCRFDDTGLALSTPLGQGHRPWSHYIRLRENDAVILLYHSDILFDLIPKRWFADPAMLQAFRTELSRHPFTARS